MNYLLDAHTHTLVSGHAYSTIREMAVSAKAHGLSLLGITEHAPTMPGTCHEFYFQNLKIIDKKDYDVPLLFGSELNIQDECGTVDLSAATMAMLDYNIASLHPPCIRLLTKEESTQAILAVIQNPLIHIIGHLDDGRFPIDYDIVAKAAKEYHTLLELNNSSLLPTSFRCNARDNDKAMLDACVRYGTKIILNSDAHVDSQVGQHDMSYALIQELGFPEDLIVNSSIEDFLSFTSQR
ncbi:MAG: phosphatase [Lachnospiraceae bacterium]